MKTKWIIQSPIGLLTLQLEDNKLEAIHFGEKEIDNYTLSKTKMTEQVILELEEYFEGKRKYFTINLSFKGTDFQKKVWKALNEIPYGETRTYKEVAKEIGHERACRAVGSANNKNPIPIIIPCHRVIGRDGKLAGYAGGLKIKEMLLQLENHGPNR